jgi:hypothetical protein
MLRAQININGSVKFILFCAPLLMLHLVCAASEIGGTYIAGGARFANMLQLTQSRDGQIIECATPLPTNPSDKGLLPKP